MPCPPTLRRSTRGGQGLAASALLVVSVLAAVLPASAAGGATTTPRTTAISQLQQAPRGPGAPPLPAACNFSWPTAAWPPTMDAQAKAHAIRLSDLPADMIEGPPQFASNSPDLDDLAVGWPAAGIAEVDTYSHRSAAASANETGIEEIVGRASSASVARATFRKARDVVFGSCVRYWPGSEGQYRYPVPWAGPHVFAFEQSDQQDHGVSSVSVVLFGYRGRFDFELHVGNLAYTPETSQRAKAPTRALLVAVLRAALARLAG